MKNEPYAFIDTSEGMQSMLGKSDKIWINTYYLSALINWTLEQKHEVCKITKIGENLFNGFLVIPWKKNFVYGEVFNF